MRVRIDSRADDAFCQAQSTSGPDTLAPGHEVSGPLAGVRVLGLEQSVAGPLCTRILADMGADVLKVERAGGDFSRSWDAHAQGESAQFWWLNRRKRSAVLDLSGDDGRRVLEELLADADVVVHNMSPRAATRLGLDGDALAERHPRLISCQISGYGADTSLRDRKAYDMLVQAESGVMSLTGTPERPGRVGVSIGDVSAGIYAATLVLGALIERERTGRGRALDVSMLDVMAEFAAPMLLSYANAGVLYPRSLDQHHAIAPYGVFTTADGRSILIACHQNDEWRRLSETLLGRPELADDARFATNADRVEHREEIGAIVAEAVARRSLADMAALLDDLGIAQATVNDIAGLASHPGIVERGVLEDVQSADGSTVTTLRGIAERAFDGPFEGRLRPPSVGEDEHGFR